jgi:uncharacterized protein (TIGR03067 family)
MIPPLAALTGTWEMIRAEFDGEAAPELVVAKTTIVLSARDYAVHFAGQVADRGTYETGGGVEPRTLILRGLEGPNAGRTIPCIYQLVGDRLRVCFGLDGVPPTEFATGTGQQRYLATYRRV